jgi:hypothetical protein
LKEEELDDSAKYTFLPNLRQFAESELEPCSISGLNGGGGGGEGLEAVIHGRGREVETERERRETRGVVACLLI